MGLAITRKASTKFRLLSTLIATFALLVQPMYGVISAEVANAASAADLFVKESGDDTNDCTSAADACKTIQRAVDVAGDGNAIEVAAGTYDEEFIIDKPLSLLGPNQDNSAVTGARVDEAILTESVRISATSGVTLSGFELANVDSPDYTVYVYEGSDGFIFKNNRFINNTKVAIKTGLTSATNNITIEGNLVDGITGANQSGIQLGGVSGVSSVSNNKVVNTSYGGILIENARGLTMSGNQIDNTPQQGIQLAGVIGDTTIDNNTITNANTAQKEDKGAIRIYGADFDGVVLIEGNTISDSYNGIAVKNGQDITGQDITVTKNSITGMTTGSNGIYHGGTGLLNAEKNFWGGVNGPTDLNPADGSQPVSNPTGTGSVAFGAVNYANWCSDTTCTPADTTGPSIGNKNPAEGQTIGGNYKVSATVSDPSEVREDSVYAKFTRDDGTQKTYYLQREGSSTNVYSLMVNTREIQNKGVSQPHSVSFRAVDKQGNPRSSKSQNVVIDNAGPSISNKTPADNAVISGTSYKVSATVTDMSGVKEDSVYVRFRDDSGKEYTTYLTKQNDQGLYSAEIDTTKIGNGNTGPNRVSFRAVDGFGSPRSSVSENVQIDNTAPSVTIDPVSSPATGTVTLSGTASDDGSGLRAKNSGNGAVSAGDVIRLSFRPVDENGNVGSPVKTYYVDVDGNGDWIFDWDTTLAPFVDGQTYRIVARANDNTGTSFAASNTAADTAETNIDNSGTGDGGGTENENGNGNDETDTGGNTTTQQGGTTVGSSPEVTALAPSPTQSFFTGDGTATGTGNQPTANTNDDAAILGAQTEADDAATGDTLGASTTAAIAPSESGWKIFGLAWYWWLLILAAVAAAWWFIAGALRRRRETPTV